MSVGEKDKGPIYSYRDARDGDKLLHIGSYGVSWRKRRQATGESAAVGNWAVDESSSKGEQRQVQERKNSSSAG